MTGMSESDHITDSLGRAYRVCFRVTDHPLIILDLPD